MATHPARRGWSYAEFARLPDDGNRYEIIDGELSVTPSPRPRHQIIATKLASLVEPDLEEHSLGWIMAGSVDVLLGEGDYLIPDVVFVRRDREAIITDRGIEGPPDLVVEVLSPSTALRDRGIKRERYAASGVPEYWIVDPDRHQIEVYRLAVDPDQPAEIATETLSSRPVDGGPVLTLSLHRLFQRFA
jgi:Uma2 family endonuclease